MKSTDCRELAHPDVTPPSTYSIAKVYSPRGPTATSACIVAEPWFGGQFLVMNQVNTIWIDI